MPSAGGYFIGQESSKVEEPSIAYGAGVLFSHAERLMAFLGLSQQEVGELLEVDPSTLFRWRKDDRNIGRLRSKVVREMDAIVAKGVSFFGSEEAFDAWLQAPNYALGGIPPVQYMKDPYTIERVGAAIEAMRWGSYL